MKSWACCAARAAPARTSSSPASHGAKPEYTGVVDGMSGSPVYIDGKLVGALSYRIGQFTKEPIAGITPIEQMLEVRDLLRRLTLRLAHPPPRKHAAKTRKAWETTHPHPRSPTAK